MGAERLGADSVWLSEHHLFEDGYLPQPLTMAAAIAARTKRIRIGTAVLLAALRPAVQIAEEAAIVDLVSGGRLVLGFGAGYVPREFEAYGAEAQNAAFIRDEPGAAFDFDLDAVRASRWAGGATLALGVAIAVGLRLTTYDWGGGAPVVAATARHPSESALPVYELVVSDEDLATLRDIILLLAEEQRVDRREAGRNHGERRRR